VIHRFDLKVYYEDTDMGGIVYYANYLKFIERARSTWVAELGIDQLVLQAKGVVFAVRDISAHYLVPARMGDSLHVISRVIATTAARWVLEQVVERDGLVLFTAEVTVVAVSNTGAARRLPTELRRILPL
jgi:acyl-CoA thioester hydrolase|tara:strand:+ start:1233 stop:1622 length:390 start_codon:yes stop_codon:yes gene_type:complete